MVSRPRATPASAATTRLALRRQDKQEGDPEERLHRDADERARREMADLVRSDEGEQHEQAGQGGGHSRGDRVPSAGAAVTGAFVAGMSLWPGVASPGGLP